MGLAGNEEPPQKSPKKKPNKAVKEKHASGGQAYAQVDVQTSIVAASYMDRRSKLVIMPEGNWKMQRWDMLTLSCLLFTAIFTPYETGFMAEAECFSIDLLSLSNRLVDTVFCIDIVLQFFVMYQEQKVGGKWIGDHKLIVKRYAKGWFLPDLIATIPLEMIGCAAASNDLKSMSAVRVVRLLRLLKLVRLVRASRIVKRWQSEISISYGVLSLIKFCFMILITGHWMACAMGILDTLQDPATHTWLDESTNAWAANLCAEEAERNPDLPCSLNGTTPKMTPWGAYTIGIYWSIMTLTSIGYGDILPQNSAERWMVVILMLLGGAMWAYLIGNACGLFASLSKDDNEFYRTLDQLNMMFIERGISATLQRRLRAFMFAAKDSRRLQEYSELLDLMSPALQGEVALASNEMWVDSVWWLAETSREFLLYLIRRVNVRLYSQREVFANPWELCVLVRGVVARRDKILASGAVFGEDQLLLFSNKLLNLPSCVALTFVELLCLQRATLDEALERFPKDYKPVRDAYVRFCFQACVWYEVRQRQGQAKPQPLLFKAMAGNAGDAMTGGPSDTMPPPGKAPAAGGPSGPTPFDVGGGGGGGGGGVDEHLRQEVDSVKRDVQQIKAQLQDVSKFLKLRAFLDLEDVKDSANLRSADQLVTNASGGGKPWV